MGRSVAVEVIDLWAPIGPDRLGDRAIAFQNCSNNLSRKSSSHPERLNLPRKEPFDPFFFTALRTMYLSTARLWGPLPNRVLS